jgi:hypothetical protein
MALPVTFVQAMSLRQLNSTRLRLETLKFIRSCL